MYLYDFAIQNKELIKLVYTIIIGIICLAIVIKTDKLFRLSLHQGIRYFRNAFFFYGLAFITRYFLGTFNFFTRWGVLDADIMKVIFEFFLIMAAFSLLYSLLWKKFETGRKSISSLFNIRFAIFYALALIIALLDLIWQTYGFMFILQIVLFSFAGIISYMNYKKSGRKQGFLRLYFFVILLNLIAWLTNFLVATFFYWHKSGVITVYIANIIIFIIFLYGVLSVTKK